MLGSMFCSVSTIAHMTAWLRKRRPLCATLGISPNRQSIPYMLDLVCMCSEV